MFNKNTKVLFELFEVKENFGDKNKGIRTQRFIWKATDKIEDEYITDLLKEEEIK